jgi:hypothetical protein
MPHAIAWCGFLGAWLLVAGPLDQAVREIEESGFEHEMFEEAKAKVSEPEPVSSWWLLLPPVWWLLKRRRESIYRHQIGEAMDDEDLLGVVGMVVFCLSITVGRTRRRRHRPAVKD